MPVSVDLCVIAPSAHLENLSAHPLPSTQLALTHMVLDDGSYADWYLGQSLIGNRVILDNSAHEKLDLPLAKTIRAARMIRAKEIALPDVIGNYPQSISRIRNSLDWLAHQSTVMYQNIIAELQPAWVVIPQGNSFIDWVRCYTDIAGYLQHFRISFPTLFPKETIIGFPTAYADIFTPQELHRVFSEFLQPSGLHVHLLGWDDSPWKWIPGLISRFSCIRSIDTSKPVVYAMTGTRPGDVYPGRPLDYFNQRLTKDQVHLAKHWIDVFEERIAEAVHERVMRQAPFDDFGHAYNE
jgi:hypothetical protein